MKEYTIPVEWSMYSTITVTASSAEEALKIAQDKLDEIPCDSSSDCEYIDGSYRITTVNNTNPADDIELVKMVKTNSYHKIGMHGIDEKGNVF